MKFTSATILIDNYGTDKVYLKTTLPSPYPAGVDPSDLSIGFDTMAGHAIEYVTKHFGFALVGVPVTVISVKTGLIRNMEFIDNGTRLVEI